MQAKDTFNGIACRSWPCTPTPHHDIAHIMVLWSAGGFQLLMKYFMLSDEKCSDSNTILRDGAERDLWVQQCHPDTYTDMPLIWIFEYFKDLIATLISAEVPRFSSRAGSPWPGPILNLCLRLGLWTRVLGIWGTLKAFLSDWRLSTRRHNSNPMMKKMNCVKIKFISNFIYH